MGAHVVVNSDVLTEKDKQIEYLKKAITLKGIAHVEQKANPCIPVPCYEPEPEKVYIPKIIREPCHTEKLRLLKPHYVRNDSICFETNYGLVQDKKTHIIKTR